MFPRILICAVALLVLGVCVPAADAAEVARAAAPVTDNYKTRWSSNPEIRELRTWLSMDALGAAGTTWAPQPRAAISFTPAQTIDVTGADGRSGRVAMRVVRGGVGVHVFRYDPDGSWGPLLNLTSGTSASQAPLLVELTLTVSGAAAAVGTLEYRHEPAFTGVGRDHWEYNGPGGRWFAGGTAIRTDWEPAPVVAPTLSMPAPTTSTTGSVPPRIVRLLMPVVTRSRMMPLRVTGRSGGVHKITHIRVALGRGSRFGAWVRVAPRYQLRLPARSATWLVRVQVRDADGQASRPAQRTVRCICG